MRYLKNLDHLIETIRKEESNPSAYQHMLNTIAGDIERTFHPVKACGECHVVPEIAAFVRHWNPIKEKP